MHYFCVVMYIPMGPDCIFHLLLKFSVKHGFATSLGRGVEVCPGPAGSFGFLNEGSSAANPDGELKTKAVQN